MKLAVVKQRISVQQTSFTVDTSYEIKVDISLTFSRLVSARLSEVRCKCFVREISSLLRYSEVLLQPITTFSSSQELRLLTTCFLARYKNAINLNFCHSFVEH